MRVLANTDPAALVLVVEPCAAVLALAVAVACNAVSVRCVKVTVSVDGEVVLVNVLCATVNLRHEIPTGSQLVALQLQPVRPG